MHRGHAPTSYKIEKILDMLMDKQYHTIREIARKLKLEQKHVNRVVEFLERYQFIQLNRNREKARIGDAIHKFMQRQRITSKREGYRKREN